MNRASVGLGTCGIAAGGEAVFRALGDSLARLGVDARLHGTGCLGACYREVLVTLESDELGACVYGDVTQANVEALVRAHFVERRVALGQLVSLRGAPTGEPEFFSGQQRCILARCGVIDPESLTDYRANGGGRGLARALAMEPDEIIEEALASGLRGRGGAGFPTGRKWAAARRAAGARKYLICNADEGDPGAFMDRNVLEGDPFAVLEGMAIAARAVGASAGIVYVREEYPLACLRIDRAVQALRAAGLLGEGAPGGFDVEVRRGAGAFVCGEETALIASLEGRRGVPRLRPPYPVERGLHGMPTVINNVETLATVCWMFVHGAAALRAIGTPESSGTKVFSLAGDVRRPGMVEVPMGTTLRAVVEHMGGGSPSGRPIKAVQIGGPSGGCVPASLLDTPIDYESLRGTGAIMGSGGLVAMDETACMVDVARYFLAFAEAESCGKCTPCRVGTVRLTEILTRLCEGEGRPGDLERLETLAERVAEGSLCGLGQSAPNPVLTTLRHFRAEYEAHLHDKRCPAGRCRALIRFRIDPYTCDGCTMCADQCGVAAIARAGGGIPLTIDPEACARCRGCLETCQFGAVEVS